MGSTITLAYALLRAEVARPPGPALVCFFTVCLPFLYRFSKRRIQTWENRSKPGPKTGPCDRTGNVNESQGQCRERGDK